MEEIKILWADDEIDLLKPHIIFLEEKGYKILPAQSGDEALDIMKENRIDLVFLDENMPGLSGLETLQELKKTYPDIPAVMITKSEEESIMEDAIGAKISDYLIKPVNPKQMLLSIKKNLDAKRLMGEKATMGYQQKFREIGMRLGDNLNYDDWSDVYKQLVYWELELGKGQSTGMEEILQTQKNEANLVFSKYIAKNYQRWLQSGGDDVPVFSHTLLKNKVFPHFEDNDSVFFILIDNLRLDQWYAIKPIISNHFWIDKEETFSSILPTTTQYSRNAIFSGLLPSEIEKKFPNMWLNDEDEGGKNNFEKDLLEMQLKRLGKDIKFSYNKVLNLDYGRKIANDVSNLTHNKLNVIVYNFVDMLSHARTDIEIIRELAEDEAAYRSLTKSWFEHSPLLEIMKNISAKGCKMIIGTDHGSIRVTKPVKIAGDKTTNTNLRYKQGKSLSYARNEVFEIPNPGDIYLPKVNVSQRFVFALGDTFFAYPNNYNYYVNHYLNTFQHGGVSMEEMMIPVVTLSAK